MWVCSNMGMHGEPWRTQNIDDQKMRNTNKIQKYKKMKYYKLFNNKKKH